MSEDRAATTEETACLDFEAWTGNPVTANEWMALARPHIAILAISSGLMHKTKAEMIEAFGKLDPDQESILVESLTDATDFFKKVATIIDSATIRLMVADAAKEVSSAA